MHARVSSNFGKKVERAGTDAQRRIRIFRFGVRLALFGSRADWSEFHRRCSRRTGRDAAGHVGGLVIRRDRRRNGNARRNHLCVRRLLSFAFRSGLAGIC